MGSYECIRMHSYELIRTSVRAPLVKQATKHGGTCKQGPQQHSFSYITR